MSEPHELRRVLSGDLTERELGGLRELLDATFEGRFDDHDWDHALGGTHVLLGIDDRLVAHASVVPRTLVVGARRVATGYVEAVAVERAHQASGLGSAATREIGDVIQAQFELGALSSASPGFYTRLGWERWRGPTYVDAPDGRRRTSDDDDGVLILRTDATIGIDVGAPLVCDWRAGDVW